MKNMLIFLIFFSLSTTRIYGGVHVTEIEEDSFPLLIIPTFFQTQVYLPGNKNRFDMAFKFTSGGIGMLNIHKNITLIGGGFISMNTAGSEKSGYTLDSRSWVQNGFHGAAGILFNKKIRNSRILVGPVISRTSYIVGGVPEAFDNTKYKVFSSNVISERSYVRGNYWNSPYLFFQWDKYRNTGKKELQVELNLLIPGRFPSVVSSWQPGSLIQVMRFKCRYDWKSFYLRGDIQIPALSESEKKGGEYRNFRFNDITFKIETGYLISFSSGGVRFIAGYQRDWHALYFPTLSKEKGTWGALYVGSRYEFLATKWMKIPQKN